MEVIIKPNADEASSEAARIFSQLITANPRCVLGLATGSTPLGLYRDLIARHQHGFLDFSKVATFNLDEYIGLAPSHPQSYAHFMRENLFSKINIAAANVRLPNGLASDIPAHCAEYENAIRDAGGIDLQLLGLGSDGHIGFNEPSSSLTSRTRLKTLTERTLADNARFFTTASEVPRRVITMGVGTIMESRRCLVLAFGEKKADAAAATVEGPITASVPSSVLQMHPRCTLILDEAAASKLQRANYYRWVYDNKPEWQRV